jgi:transmembrane sensor
MTGEDDILSVAADWHTRIEDDEPTPATRVEFDAWLAASPRHREAYGAIERMWSNMGAARADPRVLELRREALSAPDRPRRKQRFAAAAAAVLVCLAAVWGWTQLSGRTGEGAITASSTRMEGGTFRTSVGERSTVTLSDGSSVVLNTSTQVNISFSPQTRHVRLLSGQAWFQVAHNPSRPFIVEAGDQRVVALGTAFDVRVEDHQGTVQVTLLEGRVSVEPIRSVFASLLESRPPIAELAPGEALTASAKEPPHKQRADISKVSGWRRGQVVFNNDRLDAAIAELNRYTTSRIELADPALASLKVSGVFYAGRSDSFLETVTGYYPIRIVERSGERIVLGSNPQNPLQNQAGH